MPESADREEFIALYSVAQPAVQRFICASIPDLHKAEDILQEVSLVLWRKFDRYEPGSSFQSWAMKIAHYEILNVRRRYARSRLVLCDELVDRAAEHFEDQDFEAIETRQRALADCLSRLSIANQRLLGTRYRSRESCETIAKRLGRNAGQLRTQLYRIRQSLRECIEKVLALPPQPVDEAMS